MALLRWIGWRALVTAAAVAALELGLARWTGFGKWVVQEKRAYLGWRMLPDQRGWSRDLSVPESINNLGFRDEPWELPRRDPSAPLVEEPPEVLRERRWERARNPVHGGWLEDASVLRVAVVGHSMTYGTSVEHAETWPEVLERALQAALDASGDARRAQVMNFAVQGYQLEQMARNYEVNVRPFRPDFLLVPALAHDVFPMRASEDDADYVFRDWVLRSATYDWLRKRVMDKWIPPPGASALAELSTDADDELFKREPWNQRYTPWWREATERLDGVRRQVEADGGHLALLFLPTLEQLLNPAQPRVDRWWRPKLDALVAARGGGPVAFLDPLPAFQIRMAELVPEIAAPGGLTGGASAREINRELPHYSQCLFIWDDTGHFNPAGHEALGLAAADELARSGLAPARP
jgi:lysophospholipase L1-like esterase